MSPLPTRPLGRSGLDVSVVGLGCNNFGRRIDLDQTRAVVDAALEEGITFFDTADVYGRGLSEEYLGEVLQGRRDQVVLATKFGMDMGDGRGPRGSREYVLHAVDASLKRLRTDVIDYYWYHQPDGVTPIAETLEALHEIILAGKVKAVGASNFDAAQLQEAAVAAEDHGLTRFTAVQNEYSLLEREAEDEVLPACERLGIGFVPFFPLASGLLTGKYRRGAPGPDNARLSGRDEIATPEQFDLVEALQRFADERGVPLIDVAIGALLARDVVSSVIAGATRPEQVRGNAAAGRWTASEEDLAALQEVLAAHPV
ncbi:MAG TPA: aldo/keto reductase [Solirubrobacteraceae bacterium]|jgi:aryl-alcohol dehydrogenase-like predicted oxidoreductase